MTRSEEERLLELDPLLVLKTTAEREQQEAQGPPNLWHGEGT